MTRRTGATLTALTALGAALRFATLDAKGFWGDEVSTVFLVHEPFASMLGAIARLESTPPLYYSLAWVWTQAFGTSEIGLRSLSALLGVATVPVVYAAARELASRRAALVACGLVAVNPLLVWYSQEGRSYALLVFLTAVGTYWFGRVLRTGSARATAAWSLASCLALATHYFSLFVIVPEAMVLLRLRVRGSAVALAPLAAVSAALVPLAAGQAGRGHASWIAHSPLAGRVAAVPALFFGGIDADPVAVVGPAAAGLALLGAWLAARRSRGRDRSAAALLGCVAAVALAAPALLALAGVDYFSARNCLAAVVPLTIAIAAGFAVRGTRVGPSAVVGLGALSVGVIIATAGQPKFRSEDWRAAAEDLGRATAPRAVVALPGQAGRKPLEYYLRATAMHPDDHARVREVDVVVLPRQGSSRVASGELARLARLRFPAFRLARRHVERDFVLMAYVARRPVEVSSRELDARLPGRPRTLLSTPRPRASA